MNCHRVGLNGEGEEGAARWLRCSQAPPRVMRRMAQSLMEDLSLSGGGKGEDS